MQPDQYDTVAVHNPIQLYQYTWRKHILTKHICINIKHGRVHKNNYEKMNKHIALRKR